MRKTYIAGYDGSDASRAALRFVDQLANANNDEILAAAVYTQAPRVFGKGAEDGAVVALDDQSRADAELMLSEDGVPKAARCVLGAGSTAEGLHHLAEDRNAAMIAVGVTHRGALGRIVPGSTGEHLLHGAPCPVAVVPADFTTGPVRTVAVAYSETPEGTSALHAAADFARRSDARLRVLAAYDITPAATGALSATRVPSDVPDSAEESIKQDIQDAIDALPFTIDTDIRVLRGPAAPALAAACRADIDLLVTGSRGYGPVRSVLLGSVSRHLVDHAPCPVVVIPRAAPATVAAEPVVAMTAAN